MRNLDSHIIHTHRRIRLNGEIHLEEEEKRKKTINMAAPAQTRNRKKTQTMTFVAISIKSTPITLETKGNDLAALRLHSMTFFIFIFGKRTVRTSEDKEER